MQNLTTDLNTVISELNKFAETNILSTTNFFALKPITKPLEQQSIHEKLFRFTEGGSPELDYQKINPIILQNLNLSVTEEIHTLIAQTIHTQILENPSTSINDILKKLSNY